MPTIFGNRAGRATIQARIKDCDRQIAAAEAALLAVMMQSAISDDKSADEAVAKVAAFQAKRKLLDKALLAVEQDEVEKLDAAHAAERKARQRALSQHSARLQRDARTVSDLISQLVDAQEKMVATGQSLVASAQSRDLERILSPANLATMSQIEGYRLGRDRSLLLFDRPTGTRAATNDEDGSIPTLVSRVTALTNSVKSPPVVPQPVFESAPVVEAPPTLAAGVLYPPSASEPIVIDLRTNKGETANVS